MEYIYKYQSPLGGLTLASDGESITGLWIEGQKYFASVLKEWEEKPLPVFEEAAGWLDRYFKGEKPSKLPPLAPRGSEFRQQVWDILCEIPYGQVTTYGGIAERIAAASGKNMSAQAVGGAVGHNPISIMIPCHRVVGMDGSLTGYAGGMDLKVKLLELEGVDMDPLYRPTKGTAL